MVLNRNPAAAMPATIGPSVISAAPRPRAAIPIAPIVVVAAAIDVRIVVNASGAPRTAVIAVIIAPPNSFSEPNHRVNMVAIGIAIRILRNFAIFSKFSISVGTHAATSPIALPRARKNSTPSRLLAYSLIRFIVSVRESISPPLPTSNFEL